MISSAEFLLEFRSSANPLIECFQIDWEESTLAERVCVRPGIDEELDNRKHVYHGIDSVLVSAWWSVIVRTLKSEIPSRMWPTKFRKRFQQALPRRSTWSTFLN